MISKQILDEAITRKLQNYIDYINCNGAILDKIRSDLLYSHNSHILPRATDKYANIQSYNKYISFYNDQIVGMLQQVDEYELCDNKTKNMNNKELETFFINSDSML